MGERNIESEVLRVVDELGDPLMSDFVERLGLPRERIMPVTKMLVQRGILRMREDPVDHEWAYRRCR